MGNSKSIDNMHVEALKEELYGDEIVTKVLNILSSQNDRELLKSSIYKIKDELFEIVAFACSPKVSNLISSMDAVKSFGVISEYAEYLMERL